ncbi:glycosyltransferase family 4 protein [Clostridium hydrogenum]|uniref:glycosyltransferase family 4 protein n=1 Tax=Clostridium hydrogenum TaxID=2855764 RepID=UPI001F2F6FC1|nr:glycosyltransferase family 4 protein [Clostridium hydrogenum]
MKILITTDTYYPMINGVVISINNLYKQLKAAGNDVKILALSYDGKQHVEGDVYYLNSRFVRVYPQAKIIRPFGNKIIRQLIEWGPDIIHSQTEFSTMIVAKYIKRKLNIPQIHTYHTMYEDYLQYFLKGKVIGKGTMSRLIKLLFNTFDEIIAPTEKVKESLSSYGIRTGIKIAPTGIDINKFSKNLTLEEKESILNKYGLTLADDIIIYVGRIAEEKNIDEVIKLFKEVLKPMPKLKLLIVGGGPYISNLKELVAELQIQDSVKFTGMIDVEEVQKYYKLGIAFVTASKSESQGLTYIESLASGCPVICKWDLCIKDLVINGETGYTYDNKEQFVFEIQKIVSDKGVRETISANAIEKSKLYSTENFGKRVLEIYNEVLNEKKDDDHSSHLLRTIFG